MKMQNTMSRTSYVIKHLLFGASACWLYCHVLLSLIQIPFIGVTLSWDQSVWCCVLTCVTFISIGLISTIKTQRNTESLCDNILIPIGLVCAVMTFRFHPIPVIIIFGLWAALMISCLSNTCS